ncbi:MAG TPA: hypothetical protein VLQ93_07570, partial [Myxococcaceae bacterium]|nr:hypothetical protein [Myxococcaceae bacterium]
DALEVIQVNQIDLAESVDPSSGWVEARTTIEIRASNAEGKGLLSTPEAFIIIGGEEIPLLRESYLSTGDATTPSLMSAVIPSRSDDARIVVGGPYNIKVVNPDGKSGVITGAFTVLKDPPPRITAISPGRGDKGTAFTLTVTGSDFKDPVDGTPVLTVALLDASGTEYPCGATTVTQGATETEPDTASCQMTLPATTGGYLVRARHEDDQSFDLYSVLAVTESSRKLSQVTVAQPTLNTARRAHGIALGQDDLGNRFLYVVGGENGTTTAIDSGEFASVSRFGELGQWQQLRYPLPEGRTGVSLVRVGRFLYAIGGSADGTNPAQTHTVLRAHILGSDSAPVMAAPTTTATGSLAEGTWYYRVSAVLADGTVNPLGEGLPSDTESVRVPANGSVSLSWAMPVGAPAVQEYRIYRSPEPNAVKGNEVYLATIPAPSTTYTDDGSVTPGAELPLPVGSLGVWVPMAELGTPRFDAAATAVRVDANNVFLYVAGGRSANTVAGTLSSTEEAVLGADGSISSWRAGTPLAAARAEHVLRPVTHALAESLPQGYFGLAAAGGTSCARAASGCAQANIESGLLEASTASADVGKVLSWSLGGTTASRVGLTAMVVNDFFYAFNGWSGSGGSFANSSEKSSDTTCVGGPPCSASFNGFSSATMSFTSGVEYRSATEFFGAYFYFVGGSSNLNISNTSNVVLRGSY